MNRMRGAVNTESLEQLDIICFIVFFLTHEWLAEVVSRDEGVCSICTGKATHLM